MRDDRLAAARQFVEATYLRSDDAGYAGGLIRELLDDRERLRTVAEAAKRFCAAEKVLSDEQYDRYELATQGWDTALERLVAAVDALAVAPPAQEEQSR